MTYLYADTYDELKDISIILGDSNAFGLGDSFIDDDYNYSIGHNLYNLTNKKANFINLGFPGGGSQVIYKNYLNFKKKIKIKPKKIIYLFYEGNDLENNIIYNNNYTFNNKVKAKLRYYFPLFTFTKNQIVSLKNEFQKKFYNSKKNNIIGKRKYLNQINLVDKKKILRRTLQSPPIELNQEDLKISLNILFKTLTNLKKDTEDITVIYLPAPSSALDLKNPVYFEKYFKNSTREFATVEELEKLSEYIKLKIENFSLEKDIYFLDMTSILKNHSFKLEIYGPKDYSHFNKNGYLIISEEIFNEVFN